MENLLQFSLRLVAAGGGLWGEWREGAPSCLCSSSSYTASLGLDGGVSSTALMRES